MNHDDLLTNGSSYACSILYGIGPSGNGHNEAAAMFPSTSGGINPFANFSSSSSFHHFPPPFSSGFEPNNVFLNNQLHDPLPIINPRIAESLTNMALSDINITTMTHHDYYGPSNLIPNKKPPAKKDRHSKIYTAQGLRDRRVRLSIDIAREFFDLQDMLGFDKASKTLEWLLSKSRMAIKELAQMKHHTTTTTNTNNADLEATTAVVPKSKSSGDVFEENKEMEKLLLNKDAKESRFKARARARQRTREKMCTKKGQILTQFKTCVEPNSSNHDHVATSLPPMRAVTEESIVMLKRKLNPSSIFTHHHQNLAMSKDHVSENSNYISNLPQNWDNANGAIPHSTFPAITNMNLLITTGLQSCGRPWGDQQQ
ncbi:hypothetical protein EZV62_015660 [Acer yangbiense]|uniref:TCP domain-containing protein n=1 Tax=Acer yangbiense TaxID=1000413 RepID=A0A5C7HLF9_9ROSI|nr:hypothetical protein EZV62_015660 [Acer yangbiense]